MTLLYIGNTARTIFGVYNVSYKISLVIVEFAISTCELCGIYYSWIRSNGIIDLIWPRAFKPVQILISVCPLFFFLQTATAILYCANYTEVNPVPTLSLVNSASIGVSGLTVAILDCIFTYIFAKYLADIDSRSPNRGVATDRKFIVISHHGVAASVFSLCATAVYAVGFVYDSVFISALSPIFITFALWVLLRMKIVLLNVGGVNSTSTKLIKPASRITGAIDSVGAGSMQGEKYVSRKAGISGLPVAKE
ncbi:hypothetical protein HK100_007061 [Physocladia obscura]|uniref:Transmembrane protein n=1 Tax=Physocladia obscura TaxID=109957 RepID=A0AAD5X755_9FUNG|nr:hypothetical protein HK100_007061 [Physocladia obscura]